MLEQEDRTSRHQRRTGFKLVWQHRRGAPAMFSLPTRSLSTFRGVIWHSIVGRLKASAVSIPNTIKPEMTSIFAGGSSRPAGSLLSARLPLSGITDDLRCGPF